MFFSCTKWAKKKLKISILFKYRLLLLLQSGAEETWVILWVCHKKKRSNISNCKPGLPRTGQRDMNGRVTGVSHVYFLLCRVCDMLMTQEMDRDGSLSEPSFHMYWEYVLSYAPLYIYGIYTDISSTIAEKKSLPALHRPWCKTVQVGHLKSHHVVCTDCHIVR